MTLLNKIFILSCIILSINSFAELRCSVANTDVYYVNHPDITKSKADENLESLKDKLDKTYPTKLSNKNVNFKSIHYSNYEYSLGSYQFEIQRIREQFPNQNPFVILNYKNRIKDEAFNIFEQKASKETKKLIGAIKAVDATFKVVIHIKRDST
jgi:hypothetical protein